MVGCLTWGPRAGGPRASRVAKDSYNRDRIPVCVAYGVGSRA